MILRKLKDKLRSVHCIERSQLAKLFELSEDGLDAMLAIFIRKGQLKRTEQAACKGCTACSGGQSQVVYQWLEN